MRRSSAISGRQSLPGGVDARREPEADSALVDHRGIDSRRAHERSEPGSLRARELPEAGDRERAVLVDERDDVGDRAERDEVEVPLERIVRERLEKLERDARSAELGERVRRGPRRHDRAVGQLVSRPVVVGDDDVQAEPPGRRDLLDGGDAAVDGEHEPVAVLGEPLAVSGPRGRNPPRSGSAGATRRRPRAL